jgi:hypothetical protein
VEEKLLEISPPRMPGIEQGNLTRCNAGPPPSGLLARDTLGWGGLSSLNEGSPLGVGLVGSTPVSRTSLTPFPPTVFPDPAAQLTNDMLEAMDDPCRHKAVASTPGMYMYSLRGKLHLTFLLHWRDRNFLLRRLFLTDR